jgi:hypothetical protein
MSDNQETLTFATPTMYPAGAYIKVGDTNYKVVGVLSSTQLLVRPRRWYDAVLELPQRIRSWFDDWRSERKHARFTAGYDYVAGALLRGKSAHELNAEAEWRQEMHQFDSILSGEDDFGQGMSDALADWETIQRGKLWRV